MDRQPWRGGGHRPRVDTRLDSRQPGRFGASVADGSRSGRWAVSAVSGALLSAWKTAHCLSGPPGWTQKLGESQNVPKITPAPLVRAGTRITRGFVI